jgi:2-oxoglutarate ferredoxin oxidoreductase subunit alpha
MNPTPVPSPASGPPETLPSREVIRGAVVRFAFSATNLKKAGYEVSPLEDGSLDGYSVLSIDITKLTLAAVKETGLSNKEAHRCKNFWTLGLMFWMYGRPLERPSTRASTETSAATRPRRSA